MPTSYPRHSITETPALHAALAPLRDRLGDQAPSLADLILRGAESLLRELQAREEARQRSLDTFVERLQAGPRPDFEEVHGIRHAMRRPEDRH